MDSPGVGSMIWSHILIISLIFYQPVVSSALFRAQHFAERGDSRSHPPIYPASSGTYFLKCPPPPPIIISLVSTYTDIKSKKHPSYWRVSNIEFYRELEVLNLSIVPGNVGGKVLVLFFSSKGLGLSIWPFPVLLLFYGSVSSLRRYPDPYCCAVSNIIFYRM